MLTGTSLWDVRGEPAMGSIMDFGPKAGLDSEIEFCELQLEFCDLYVMFPNLSTWHSQTMTFTQYLLSPRQLHLQNKKKYTPVLLLQLVWCSRSILEPVEAT